MWIPSTSLSLRATPITPDNKSNAVTITTWATLVTLVLMFLAREAIKFAVLRRFTFDDLFLLLATVFAIGLSVTSLILASDGLGIFDVLTLRRANDIMKGFYASEFLYISSLGFAKLSIVAFFYSIYHQRSQRRYILWFGIFIFTWTLASLVAVAFQCGLPRPWELLTLHCYNSGAFWIVYCIIDMTSDVSIIMLSVNLVAYLKVRLSRKIIVVACFAPRILVVATSLARLIYLYPVTPHDSPAFNLWVPVICTQVQVCLSISTACIPYMKTLFEPAEQGSWRSNDVERKRVMHDDSQGHGSLTACLKGHKRNPNSDSVNSTAPASLKYTKTPDVSPRIPSPPPLSPLTPPRYSTPPNTSASISRSPSERGLRLHIPTPEIQIRRPSEVASPQTPSSHALSPDCLSPQPLLSPPSLSPTGREPSPPPRSHDPRPHVSDPRVPSPSRFSLFPKQRAPRYSLIPQQYAKPKPSIPSAISERTSPKSRTSTRGSVHYTSPSPHAAPETRPASPPRSDGHASRGSSLNRNLAITPFEDPMRSKRDSNISIKRKPVPAPTDVRTSRTIPSHYARNPPPRTASASPSPQTAPSYYIATSPRSNPPTSPLPTLPETQRRHPVTSPYAESLASHPSEPLSPHRQRNRRVLTPQNSSRPFQMSPVSPESPPTPMGFWREEHFPRRTEWEEVDLTDQAEVLVVRDVRSSPRIVVRRFE